MEQIKIKPCSYEGYEHISGPPEIVELYPTHLIYKARATGKRMNSDLGIHEQKDHDVESIIIKSRISAIDYGYSNQKNSYEMELWPSGLVFVFESKEEGDKVKTKIFNWLVS